jgi:predicted short-subunit dehydrogenase-like oxidoreductase (DUF2520 family)
VESLDYRETGVDIVIMAVPDDKIQEVAEQMWLDEGTYVFHTSASMSITALNWATAKNGVFYPLQTFTKGRDLDFSEIPICIEGADEDVLQVLIELASSLSREVFELGHEKRRLLHLSAVFSCNFVNYMYLMGQAIVQGEDLTFSMLHPLIMETARKAVALGPEMAQTGPAMRKDVNVMKAQMSLLEGNAEMIELYRLLSDGIMTNLAAS